MRRRDQNLLSALSAVYVAFLTGGSSSRASRTSSVSRACTCFARGHSLSLADFYSRSTMVASECFPVNGFDTRDLVVCQLSELPFPPAARKRTRILVQEPE